MRMVFYLVLLAGMGLAGGAVYMASNYIGAYEAEMQRLKEKAGGAGIVTQDVLVANARLRYGQPIKPGDVRLVAFPEDAIPDGSFHSLEEFLPQGDSVLRTAVRAMEANEAVIAMKVTEPGEEAGVSSRLSPGMRAFAIKVDVSTGVSGFLRPGDRVDVYWTGRVPGQRNGGNVTKLIESGVELIAVDQEADKDANDPTVARTVTVEATPKQVAALATAQSTGTLSLSLVGAEDETEIGAIEINQSTLLGIEEEIAIVEEAPEVCTIRTRRGADIVETVIPCSN